MAQENTMTIRLCPAQQLCYEKLRQLLPLGEIFALSAGTGKGCTTLLRLLHAQTGGVFLNMRDFMAAMRRQDPAALEETFEQLVLDALAGHDQVIVDDLHILTAVVLSDCNYLYPRKGLLSGPLTTLATHTVEAGKRLIFGVQGQAPGPIHERCHYARIPDFDPDDYQSLCQTYLGEGMTARLDFSKVFRFARELNAHQLKAACQYLRAEPGELDADRFIDYLRANRLFSNVDLGEVQPVDLHDLHGVDDVIHSLEANIIVPLENDDLAAELNLKPKRGVLLAGPPGSGKTTVGRALAHRLKSKFFLLDGTYISGSRDFYAKVHQLFEQAKQNAPAIIFIDDSDVLFENREEHGPGLYRYLLTLLDGLESETAGRVCVMMTVMDVAALPPALVRSGRVELWLDMRLPDATARKAILRQHLASLPASLGEVEVERLAEHTDSFTGADLKRLVEDGKALLAYDKVRGLPLRAATNYFLDAIETVRLNKQRYAEAEARAHRPNKFV
jgi:predicted AAA+ superfamily ATPase